MKVYEDVKQMIIIWILVQKKDFNEFTFIRIGIQISVLSLSHRYGGAPMGKHM